MGFNFNIESGLTSPWFDFVRCIFWILPQSLQSLIMTLRVYYMQDQHLCQTPAIDMSMDTTDYYYPDWEWLADLFFAVQGWKIAGMAVYIWTHNLEYYVWPLGHCDPYDAFKLSLKITYPYYFQVWCVPKADGRTCLGLVILTRLIARLLFSFIYNICKQNKFWFLSLTDKIGNRD